jgi:hypothetical protein
MIENIIAFVIWAAAVAALIYWLWKLDWGSSP